MTSLPLTVGNHEHELVALVALLQSSAMPKAHLASMVEHVGSAVEVLRNAFGGAFGAETQAALFDLIPIADRERAAKEVAGWSRFPWLVSSILDDTYPQQLRSIHNRPPLLFIEGRAAVLDTVGVAVVGARKATPEGLKRATRMTKALAAAGLTIVSGMAAGIDSAAHRAALEAGAPTVAVLGTGLTRVYPPENADLARQIVASGGALVSQFLPTQGPAKWTFPTRNITMSGLSVATVVIEASETSGARMQARSAIDHGRTVFLLKSLVESHEWARKMVEVGYHGIRANILSDPAEVVDRLDPAFEPRVFCDA